MLWKIPFLFKCKNLLRSPIRASAVTSNLRFSSSSLVYQQKAGLQEKSKEFTTNFERDRYRCLENTEIEGFRVTQIADIPDFQCKLIKLVHVATGAEYVHIDRDDCNNVFSIAFRTTPFDSTGLPHILEHMTLCGSKKYPCRDPFFKMLNRSLATFMNAMTGPDYTVYPFATQNRADYYNLMSVYLDAVFKPQLKEYDFKQEGWRLEHEDVYDKKSPIIFKGVVFNEMKGVFSENHSIFVESVLNNILPSHTYGVISGGDPLIIPQLNHKNLVDFHAKYYHPSNSKIYSYGNFDFRDHLKFVNDVYLQPFGITENYSKLSQVPSEPRWVSPRQKHVVGRHDPLAPDHRKQSAIAVTYLLDDITLVKEMFLLQVVSKLLTDGPNSAFYKTLIDTNIGSGYAPVTGFDNQTRDTTFSIGLQGVHPDDFGKIQEIIDATFVNVIKNGFDEKDVENVLHGIELRVKHQESNFGLDLLFGITSIWNHNGDLAKAFRISDHIASLRKELKNNPSYFQQHVENYFKFNPHHLVLTMSPEDGYEERIKVEEEKLLSKKLSILTAEERDKIYQDGLNLRKEQEKLEDLSCLPTLKISDIKPSVVPDPVSVVNSEGVDIYKFVLPTNGISYFRAVVDVSEFSEELKALVPLFTEIVSEMGTSKNDYRNFDQLIHRKTGGLTVTTHVAESVDDSAVFEESICFGSRCLDRNAEGMFNIWSELINEVSLNDLNRFATLVRMTAGDLINGIADSGHHYAMLNASSTINSAAYRKEVFSGLTFVRKMKEIAQMDDLSSILNQIKEISNKVMCKKHIRCSINLSPDNEKPILSNLHSLISNVPGQSEIASLKSTFDLEKENVKQNQLHYILPFAVNYAAKALPSVPFTSPEFAPLKVLCRLLTTKYLLPLVREKYGAYGSGVALSTGGVIQYYSYRDPNSVSTLDIFDGAIEWIQKNEFSDDDIKESKLGVFQNVDTPIPPSSKGMRFFLYGISDNIFNQYRSNLINVDREAILNVANKYISHNVSDKLSSKVLIGPENDKTQSWTRIHP